MTTIETMETETMETSAPSRPYRRDLKNLKFHLLVTGHFALEEDGARMADLMLHFLRKNVTR